MTQYKTDYNSNSAYLLNLAYPTDLTYAPRNLTANATLGTGYPIISVDVSAGPVTFSLASISTLPNQTIYIRRIDPGSTGNTLTVQPQAGYTIFGAASYVMNLPNQVIQIYRDPTVTDWRSLVSPSLSNVAAPLVTNAISVGTVATTVGYFPWTNATYSTYTSRHVSCWVVPSAVAGKDLTIALVQNGITTIGSVVVSALGATGIYRFSFTAPGADARLDLQVSRTGVAANDPIIYGAVIELSP